MRDGEKADLLSDVISGTVSGIVSGVLLALVLLAFNYARNRLLERKLRRGFARCGTGLGDGFMSLIVENRLSIAVRVRTVILAGVKGQGRMDLGYMRPIAQAALFNALGQDSSPNRIRVGAHFSTDTNPEAGVELAGFSGGIWGVPYHEVRRQAWSIEDAWMILEYPTLLGGSAFIRVHLDAPTLGLVRKPWRASVTQKLKTFHQPPHIELKAVGFLNPSIRSRPITGDTARSNGIKCR
jgi:hypothetical protein